MQENSQEWKFTTGQTKFLTQSQCEKWIQTKDTVLKSQNTGDKRQTPMGLQKKGDRAKGKDQERLEKSTMEKCFQNYEKPFPN